jgi:tetratricopeptide (TPR) repeat protein
MPAYARMLTNRGRYLALFGQHKRASAAFEQALTLNPNLTLARQGLEESVAKEKSP